MPSMDSYSKAALERRMKIPEVLFGRRRRDRPVKKAVESRPPVAKLKVPEWRILSTLDPAPANSRRFCDLFRSLDTPAILGRLDFGSDILPRPNFRKRP